MQKTQLWLSLLVTTSLAMSAMPLVAAGPGSQSSTGWPAQPRSSQDLPPPGIERLTIVAISTAPGATPKRETSPPIASEQSLIIDRAMAAVAGAALAASAAEARIASLERTVAQLRGESQASAEQAADAMERLRQAQGAGQWLRPLLWALGLCVALLAGVGWWLFGQTAPRRRLFQDVPRMAGGDGLIDLPSSRLPTAPIPFVASGAGAQAQSLGQPVQPSQVTRKAGAGRTPDASPWRGKARPESRPGDRGERAGRAERTDEAAVEQTRPLPASTRVDPATARDVSIEVLIDLEQKAEFFVVLGQDEAAIELLSEHIRHTGGGSPLPFLKLLGIYHRVGKRSAYDSTRASFNQRFNAYAPDWDTGLQHGRSLEDYEGLMPRLVEVWPRPLDAMAELEALLFRRSRGELFDLPAYREVLLLYALARDLQDRHAAEAGGVDLLLPLADGGGFGGTAPHPYYGNVPGGELAPADDGPRVSAPVDLDLSATEKPTSIFDIFDHRPQPPRR